MTRVKFLKKFFGPNRQFRPQFFLKFTQFYISGSMLRIFFKLWSMISHNKQIKIAEEKFPIVVQSHASLYLRIYSKALQTLQYDITRKCRYFSEKVLFGSESLDFLESTAFVNDEVPVPQAFERTLCARNQAVYYCCRTRSDTFLMNLIFMDAKINSLDWR